MRVRRPLTLLAAVTSLFVAGVAGGGAATASAETTAELSLPFIDCEDGYGNRYDYIMRVTGTTDYAARRVEVQLYGEDEWYDDKLGDKRIMAYDTAPGYYWYEFCVNSSTLNEDWGRDEVYAKVTFVTAAGYAPSVKSNVLKQYF
jgi:hypothetical protein